MKMTVKEFYDYAVKNGLKNAEIIVHFDCSDDYYSFSKVLTKEEIHWYNKEIFISMDGD